MTPVCPCCVLLFFTSGNCVRANLFSRSLHSLVPGSTRMRSSSELGSIIRFPFVFDMVRLAVAVTVVVVVVGMIPLTSWEREER